MTHFLIANSFLGLPNSWLGGPEVFGVPLGKWAGLLVAAAIGLFVGWLSAWPTQLILRRVKGRVPELKWP